MSNTTNADQFQDWLMQMDEAIDRFLESAPPELRIPLNGSDQSLSVLEKWLLSKYPTVEAARSATEARFLDGAARYVGEIFRKRTGSAWSINFSDSFAFRGLPILVGGPVFAEMPECPLTLITASLDRRSGVYLSSILHNLAG